MEAKEKAKQLVKTFKRNISGWDYYHDVDDSVDQLHKAKESANNCVREIIEGIKKLDFACHIKAMENELLYWEQVRSEINLIAST